MVCYTVSCLITEQKYEKMSIYPRKKYEKQRNSEKMWRFDDFVGSSGHRNIGSSDHRNLNGIYTDVFGGLRERKKSLKEIFN